nr:ribonuclease H-like domain-containing protein [Tanacetum cinerariifolium]
MTSFGYRSNPRYAIKKCSSCGTLYARDCVCSIGIVKDKILVPKPPKNGARCTRCGYLVDGPHCQGCALLRQEFKEILDNGSFIDEIIFDLNRAPNSPNQFHCKDVLKDGEACKRCTCTKCGSGLSKGLCYICGHNQNSLNNSPRISETSSRSPLNINHCCYECGDLLDGIFCKRCTCKSCGKDAHIGYNYSSKVPVISLPEPCNNQTIDELPQALPIFHPTFHSEAESPFTLDSTPTYVDESPNIVQKKLEEKRIEEGQATNAQYWKIPACCDDDDDYNSAITPVLSTEEPDNSLSMGDEYLDTISATKSDEVIKSSVEDLVPILSEFKGIPDTMCDVHLVNNLTPLEVKDHFKIVINSNNDISSSDDDSLYNENVEYVEASPHDSEVVSLGVAEIVTPEEDEIEDDNLREKLLNVKEIPKKGQNQIKTKQKREACVCNASEGFKKHNQLMKLMHILMGLDDSYMLNRSSILSREVLPDVRSAYATFFSEESHRVASSSLSGSSQRSQTSYFVSNAPNRNNFQRNNQNLSNGPRPNNLNNNRQSGGSSLVCENYGFNGHTIDRCFKIIGYPADFGKNKFNQSFKGKIISNNNSIRTSLSFGFTDEQMATLISLIKENKIGKNVEANMTENKVVVAFDENKCYFLNQDLSLRSVDLGTGSQCEGLYYYNNQDPVLNVLKNSLLFDNNDTNLYCEICQRAKQTREPFALSNHVSSSLGELVHLELCDSDKVKNDTANVFQDVNHINFFDLEYPEISTDDERVDPKLNSDNKSQSASSSSS